MHFLPLFGPNTGQKPRYLSPIRNTCSFYFPFAPYHQLFLLLFFLFFLTLPCPFPGLPYLFPISSFVMHSLLPHVVTYSDTVSAYLSQFPRIVTSDFTRVNNLTLYQISSQLDYISILSSYFHQQFQVNIHNKHMLPYIGYDQFSFLASPLCGSQTSFLPLGAVCCLPTPFSCLWMLVEFSSLHSRKAHTPPLPPHPSQSPSAPVPLGSSQHCCCLMG